MNFKIATSSVTGSTHLKSGYNNQDAYEFYQGSNVIIGVVADGCGGGSNSEVGAKLGVDFVLNFCRNNFTNSTFEILKLKDGLINYLKNIIKLQQPNDEFDFIENYLLFTLIGFIIKPDQTFIFHSGDGVYCLNEKEVFIDQNNRPNYIAKNLISGKVDIGIEFIDTKQVSQLLIATDGLSYLREDLKEDTEISGVNVLSHLFENQDYFDDMLSLPRFLTGLSSNRDILKDDTTLIMLMKK